MLTLVLPVFCESSYNSAKVRVTEPTDSGKLNRTILHNRQNNSVFYYYYYYYELCTSVVYYFLVQCAYIYDCIVNKYYFTAQMDMYE